MYTSPLLQSKPGIVHGFSGVSDGNMDYRFGPYDEVAANRTKFLAALGLSPEDCVQQRGLTDGIQVVTRSDACRGMTDLDGRIQTNALITNQKNVGLFLCIADCLPIIIYDPVKSVVALIHAARDSTNLKLSEKVVGRMATDFGSDPADLLVSFGPAIQAESYVYDANIRRLVTAEWKPFLHVLAPDRITVDNVAYNRAQLIAAGVPEAGISDSKLDTGRDPAYFSHVRATKTGQPEGRLAAVVALR